MLCPKGKFLQGFRQSGGRTLAHIVEAKCCSPQTYFGTWGSCYDEDVADIFGTGGWATCKPGFYIVGLYKSACNELRCLERFRCCDMGEPGKCQYNRSGHSTAGFSSRRKYLIFQANDIPRGLNPIVSFPGKYWPQDASTGDVSRRPIICDILEVG